MAEKKKSWYVVKKGRTPGIYRTWAECQKQVIGFPGAVFKGFYTEADALAYQKSDAAALKKPTLRAATPKEIPLNPSVMTVYVDGSYDVSRPDRYSFGAVFLYQGTIKTEGRLIVDPEGAKMRNVAGEIAGARHAMETVLGMGLREMELCYDYFGIEKWCTGAWRANLPATKALAVYYDSIRDALAVRFRKIESHTGVRYNEMADRLAKAALIGNCEMQEIRKNI